MTGQPVLRRDGNGRWRTTIPVDKWWGFPLPGEPSPPVCGWCGGLREITRASGTEPCTHCQSKKADAAAEGDRGA